MELAGRRVLVLGLGRFSGGVETIKFLAGAKAAVTVSDHADPAALSESVRAVEGTGARLVFGPQTPDLLDAIGADGLVVASPAMPFDHPVLVEAERRGIETTSEIAMFLARCPAQVLGVTGTKGKSTTATMLANMLTASGRRAHLGGNVGRSLLNSLARIHKSDAVVLELSSFQLHSLRSTGFRPSVAVVTNLFPDHLDRHGSFDHYASSKRVILESQTADDVAVLPQHDAALRAHGFETAGAARRVRFAEGRYDGEAAMDFEGFPLWGRVNRVNAAAAAAAATASGATRAEVRAGLLATRPLPHRLQPVHEAEGILFVDDSIATTPESVAAALEAVPRPCVVLVGGKEKGCDLEPLLAAVAERARGVVGIGTTGSRVVAEVLRRGGVPAVSGGKDLDSAVRAALSLARRGDCVLLSPGHSSLDQFASFAERGDLFAAAARRA